MAGQESNKKEIKRILIIDDDADFNEACRNMLEAVDYEVGVENKHEHAYQAIVEFKPELILLDVLMDNKLAGFEIAETMAKDIKFKEVPIILLTGYFMRTGLRDLQNEMMTKWENIKFVLDKPVKPATLLATIKRCS
ncbi:MAG: response regulator [bacterium]|nr:response regulator [bacterium]